jgi:hypothetical protein
LTYFEQTQPMPTFIHISCRKYSLKKSPQFSLSNSALDAPPSNTGGFLLRDTCVPSTYLKKSIRSKQSLSCPWKLWFAVIIPFNN